MPLNIACACTDGRQAQLYGLCSRMCCMCDPKFQHVVRTGIASAASSAEHTAVLCSARLDTPTPQPARHSTRTTAALHRSTGTPEFLCVPLRTRPRALSKSNSGRRATANQTYLAPVGCAHFSHAARGPISQPMDEPLCPLSAFKLCTCGCPATAHASAPSAANRHT